MNPVAGPSDRVGRVLQLTTGWLGDSRGILRNMLMVILGAGASYDALPTHPPPTGYSQRMPLADELFDNRETFAQRMRFFPRCLDVVPRLHRPLAPITVESALELLRDEAATDPLRNCQLAAVRFYLQSVIMDTEDRWLGLANGMTNHRTLIDQILHCGKPNDVTCFVTFNYDRILESALSRFGFKFDSLPDYVGPRQFRVVKLHGSVDWLREIESIESIPKFIQLDSMAQANAMIEHVNELKITNHYRMLNEPVPQFRNVATFPAIAIPVQNKDEFECPSDHVDMLRQFIRDHLTKILIIGWRGGEIPFRKLLAEQLAERPVSIMVVDPDAIKICQSLKSAKFGGEGASFTSVNRGFSHFIKDPWIGNKFLTG